MKYPMPGICGGKNGAPNEMILRYGSDDPFRVAHTANYVPISAGERIMFDYGGGGGWGDPLDREPQAVLDDVLDEYVSFEGAARDYGVVLTGSLEDLTSRSTSKRRTGSVPRCAPSNRERDSGERSEHATELADVARAERRAQRVRP